MLDADFLNDPLGHLGMGFKQSFLEFAELVGFAGVVIDQADDPPGVLFVERDNVERLKPQLGGQKLLLQRFFGQVGEQQRLEQAVVDDHAVIADVA